MGHPSNRHPTMPTVIELPRLSVAEKKMLAALTARQLLISKVGLAVRPRLHVFAPQQSPMPMPGGLVDGVNQDGRSDKMSVAPQS